MRLLVLFFGIVAAALVAVGLVNYWVDPLGEFYDSGGLSAAMQAPERCAISNDVIGPGSWLPFKLDIVERRQPKTVVVGTSRVLKIAPKPGETSFANVGIPGTGTDTLEPLFRRLRARLPGRVTVYLGVETFWLNRTWGSAVGFDSSPLSHLKYVLARENARESLKLVRQDPGLLLRRRRVERVGARCVVDRASRVAKGEVDAWEVDGSFDYRFELVPSTRRVPSDDYMRDLVGFRGIYYGAWHVLDRGRLVELDGALALARRYGWRVVGFTPPYSTRYFTRLTTAPETAASWRRFPPAVGALFARHGFPFLDLRDVCDVPCAESAFVDDGWHPDHACAQRVRQRLDETTGTAGP